MEWHDLEQLCHYGCGNLMLCQIDNKKLTSTISEDSLSSGSMCAGQLVETRSLRDQLDLLTPEIYLSTPPSTGVTGMHIIAVLLMFNVGCWD